MIVNPWDLNTALVAVDRFARRESIRATKRLYGRSCTAIRTSSTDHLKLEDIQQSLERAILHTMVAAHQRAVQVYAAWSAAQASTKGTKREREALKKLYSSIAKSVSDKTMSKVRERLVADISGAIARGRTKDYRKLVKGSLKALGIDDQGDHLVRTVTRTQASLAFNAAAWSESKDDGLWGYEYRTAGDERVRESHQALDGVRYPRDHEFWERYAPLNGWNCRCGLNPIYRGDKKARVKSFRGTPDVDPEFQFNPGKIFAL